MRQFIEVVRRTCWAWMMFSAVAGAASALFVDAETDAEEVTISAAARVLPPPRNYEFPIRQSYRYSAEWHLLSAGKVQLSMESSEQGRHAVVLADSAGVVNFLFAVHDHFRTTINPHTFCSLAVSKHTEEGSRRRNTEVRFDYSRRKSILHENNLKTGQIKDAQHDIPGCVTDVMSGFYYLGSLPLVPAAIFVFPVNDGGATSEITATVEAREQVNTPAGRKNATSLASETSKCW